MTLDKKQIVRQAYKIAENKDLEGWVVPRLFRDRTVQQSGEHAPIERCRIKWN